MASSALTKPRPAKLQFMSERYAASPRKSHTPAMAKTNSNVVLMELPEDRVVDHLPEVPEAHPFGLAKFGEFAREDEPTDDGVNYEEPLEQDDREREQVGEQVTFTPRLVDRRPPVAARDPELGSDFVLLGYGCRR